MCVWVCVQYLTVFAGGWCRSGGYGTDQDLPSEGTDGRHGQRESCPTRTCIRRDSSSIQESELVQNGPPSPLFSQLHLQLKYIHVENAL